MKLWRQMENPTLSIYLKTISVKFHPDPIWNNGDSDFFDGRPQQKEEEQQDE